MYIETYSDFRFIISNPLLSSRQIGKKDRSIWSASFRLEKDVSLLFPYINAVEDDAVYYEKPEHIRLLFDGYRCLLYPDIVTAHFFESRTQAQAFILLFFEYLDRIYCQREQIQPNYDQIRQIPIIDILKILPRTNCGECGHPTCMSFAADVIKGKIAPERCPGLGAPMHLNAVYPVLDDQGRMVESVSLRVGPVVGNPPERKTFREQAGGTPAGFGLTERETEVLELISRGNTNNEIAGLLFISPHTVKSHMINIFNKMGVNDRTQAAVIAAKNGMI